MMTQAYYEDAIPLLESGVKTAPTRPDLHAALGECYFSDGKVQKAILEFEKLLKFEPSAGSYAFLALCYRHLGQFDQAKKYLSGGLKSDPRNARTYLKPQLQQIIASITRLGRVPPGKAVTP